MALRVVTPPTEQLLALEDAKVALRIEPEDNEQDDFISALCVAAERRIEAETHRRFTPQVLEWVLDSWCDRMVLPLAGAGDSDTISIVSVTYTDITGVTQTLDAATMYWDRPAGPTRSVVRQWFAVYPWLGDGAERVVIRFQLEGTPDLALHAQTAAKLLVSHWFRNRDAVVGVDNRDSSTPLPFGVEELVQPLRWEIPQ